MPRRIVLLLFLLAALAACDVKPVIKRRVTLNFADDRQYVRVTATTEMGTSGRGAIQQRLAAEREALRNETDEWSKRIASVAPVSEEIVTQRQNGAIQRVEHSAVIQRDDLQRFFSDLPLTITLMRGDGFSELSLYPGTSTRATRTQREEVKAILEASSADAARYINATSVLYQYLDAHPERATAVFTILYDEKQTSTIEEEQALIETVRTTADTLLQRLETSERNAFTIDEEFDLVYNPSPPRSRSGRRVRSSRPRDSRRPPQTVRSSAAQGCSTLSVRSRPTGSRRTYSAPRSSTSSRFLPRSWRACRESGWRW